MPEPWRSRIDCLRGDAKQSDDARHRRATSRSGSRRSAFMRRERGNGVNHPFELLRDLHRRFDGVRALRDASDDVHVVALRDFDAVVELPGGAVGARAAEDAGRIREVAAHVFRKVCHVEPGGAP